MRADARGRVRTPVSRWTWSFACLRAPVSEPRVFLCVYMHPYACEYTWDWRISGEVHIGGAETHPPAPPTSQPPAVLEMGEAGRVPHPCSSERLCVSVLGLGGSERLSGWPEEPSRATGPTPAPSSTPRSENLGNDLDSSLFPHPAPAYLPEKRKNQARSSGTQLPTSRASRPDCGRPFPASPTVATCSVLLSPASVSLWGRWRGEAPCFPGGHFMAVILLKNFPG